MKQVRQLAFVFGSFVKQELHHPYAALAVVVTWSLRIGLNVLFYHVIYNLLHRDEIKGLSVHVAVSSMLLYAIFMGFGLRRLNDEINEDYIHGRISSWINKPVSYVLLKLASVVGHNVLSGFGVIGAVLLYWFVWGMPDVDDLTLRLIGCALLTMGGFVMAYLFYALIGFTAFWLGDSSGVFMVFDKIIMLLGGAYIPVAFFPPLMRFIGESLPMGSMLTMSQAFFPDFLDNLPRFLSMQLLWIAILGALFSFVYRRASLRLTVNGG